MLVLGGTEFMGRCVVDALVAAQPAFDVVMFNRGKRHWGDVNRHASVTHIRGDRHDAPVFAAALRARRWAAIVDFTCFTPRDLTPVLDYAACAEASPQLLYVFISSGERAQPCVCVRATLLTVFVRQKIQSIKSVNWSRACQRLRPTMSVAQSTQRR